MIFRILSWGTAAFVFVVGFGMERHALFEFLQPNPSTSVENAREKLVKTFESDSSLDAAQARLSYYESKDKSSSDEDDAWWRALALLLATPVFGSFFVCAVCRSYDRLDSEDQILSKKFAVSYSASVAIASSLFAAMIALL